MKLAKFKRLMEPRLRLRRALCSGKDPEAGDLEFSSEHFVSRANPLDLGLIERFLRASLPTRSAAFTDRACRALLTGLARAPAADPEAREREALLRTRVGEALAMAPDSAEVRRWRALLRADELLRPALDGADFALAQRAGWSRWALDIVLAGPEATSGWAALDPEPWGLAAPAALDADRSRDLAEALVSLRRSDEDEGPLARSDLRLLRRLWQSSRRPWGDSPAAPAATKTTRSVR